MQTSSPQYVKPQPPSSTAVEIVAIMDRSGSMQHIAADVIGGFNRFLAEQQALPGEATLSLVLFDHEYKTPVVNTPLDQVLPLSSETYVPRGMTALHDAVGRTLSNLFERNPEKAIILIATDGFENASKEFKLEQVKNLIKAAQNKGYEVVYTAANQDAFAVGSMMGVATNFTFTADAAGVAQNYVTLSSTTRSYRAQ